MSGAARSSSRSASGVCSSARSQKSMRTQPGTQMRRALRPMPSAMRCAATGAGVSAFNGPGMVARSLRKPGCNSPSLTSGVLTHDGWMTPTRTPCAASSMRQALHIASTAAFDAA